MRSMYYLLFNQNLNQATYIVFSAILQSLKEPFIKFLDIFSTKEQQWLSITKVI